MLKIRPLLYIFAGAVVAAFFSSAAVADPGARPMAMGGAFVAVADDAHSTYYNPAGLATGTATHLTYSGRLDRRHESQPRFNDFFGVAFSQEVREDTFGVGLGVLRDRNRIERNGISLRQKDRHVNFGVAYRMQMDRDHWYLGRSLAVGANLKSLRREWSSIRQEDGTKLPSTDDGWTFDYDFGILWEVGAGFSVGALAQYLNTPTFTLADDEIYEGTELGRRHKVEEWFNLRPGIAWKSPGGAITLALDFFDVLNESRGEVDGDIRVGAEWATGLGAERPGNGLVLRAGGYHLDNRNLESATAGIGFRSDAGWFVDYTAIYGEATSNNLLSMIGVGWSF